MYNEDYGKDLATINNSANGKYVVYHFSTTGYQNVVMTMAVRRSAQGFNSTVWSYSTDSVNFTTLTNVSTVPDTSTIYELKTIDLTGIAAINDQANVYLRCQFDGAQSASASFRTDNVSISAYPSGPDIWGPRVNNVSAPDSVTVLVAFNEPVNDTTAGNVANYELDNGLSINAISVIDNYLVELKTSEMSEDVTYSLIVRNVKDTTGNVMASDTINFTYSPEGGFIHNTNCDNIAQLKANMSFSNHSISQYSTEVFRLNGEVVVTAVASYKNQKVIQDETGAILIFDDGNVLDPTGTLEVGDKIRGLQGTLTNYYGFLEFKPTTAFEEKTAIYQEVAPLEITLDQLNDEATQLIKTNIANAENFPTLDDGEAVELDGSLRVVTSLKTDPVGATFTVGLSAEFEKTPAAYRGCRRENGSRRDFNHALDVLTLENGTADNFSDALAPTYATAYVVAIRKEDWPEKTNPEPSDTIEIAKDGYAVALKVSTATRHDGWFILKCRTRG